jgi:hypothetical protein
MGFETDRPERKAAATEPFAVPHSSPAIALLPAPAACREPPPPPSAPRSAAPPDTSPRSPPWWSASPDTHLPRAIRPASRCQGRAGIAARRTSGSSCTPSPGKRTYSSFPSFTASTARSAASASTAIAAARSKSAFLLPALIAIRAAGVIPNAAASDSCVFRSFR